MQKISRLIKLIICLTVLFFSNAIEAQIEQQWTQDLNGPGVTFQANSLNFLDEYLIFVQTNLNNSRETISIEVKTLRQDNGVEVWNYLWPNVHPSRTDISILPIANNQLFFFVNNKFANANSFYGVIELFDGIIWQDTIASTSKTNISLIYDNLLMDLSKSGGSNKLRLVDKFGAQKWQIEFGTYNSRHALTSNGTDQALWLNGNHVSLIEQTQQLVARDSSTFFYDAYAHFSMENNIGYSLNWGIDHFSVRKYENMFLDQQTDTLPYGFNIFGRPNPTITTDNSGNLFLASDYTYDGQSFIVMYDSLLNMQWNVDSNDAIVNLFPRTDEIVLIDKNSINLINKQTGATLITKPFRLNEEILDQTSKNEVYNPLDKSVYLFTKQDSSFYLHRYSTQYSSNYEVNNNTTLDLYPNPSAGKLSWTSNVKFNHCSIYNMLGNVVYDASCKLKTLDISSLSDGVYLLKLSNKNEYASSIFIKYSFE